MMSAHDGGREPQGTAGTATMAGSDRQTVDLFAMMPIFGVNGNSIIDSLYRGQSKYPIREVWSPALQLPPKMIDFVCAVCADVEPEIRQTAVLLLKRYAWHATSSGTARARAHTEPQLVALTCVNVALKHWRKAGLPEPRLHWLSRNAFTRQHFIDAESDVMASLGCIVHWAGCLLSEWGYLLLSLISPLLDTADDAHAIGAVMAHIADSLCFQDEMMSTHWPSELAGGVLHASVTLCTKSFQRHAVTLRTAHLCRIDEERMVQLSEHMLSMCLGSQCAELILEGSGITADDSSEDCGTALPVPAKPNGKARIGTKRSPGKGGRTKRGIVSVMAGERQPPTPRAFGFSSPQQRANS